MKAYNIEWDISVESDLEESQSVVLPDEIEIPAGITDVEEISDYISDVTGFCHKGFLLTNK